MLIKADMYAAGGEGMSYIDFNNVIYTETLATGIISKTYTATEDCYVFCNVRPYGGGKVTLKVNDKKIDAVANGANTTLDFHMSTPAKAGDVITITSTNANNNGGALKVYGLSSEVVENV